jgi:hypothetical protein
VWHCRNKKCALPTINIYPQQGLAASTLAWRSIEILDQRGIAERFISQGTKHKAVHLQVPWISATCPPGTTMCWG